MTFLVIDFFFAAFLVAFFFTDFFTAFFLALFFLVAIIAENFLFAFIVLHRLGIISLQNVFCATQIIFISNFSSHE